jgi:endoglucanase
VNLSGWFQPEQAGRLAFSRYGEQDFRNLKALGVDGVRLPINFAGLTGSAPDYAIDPRVFVFLDQALDWAAAQGIAVVLDNHSDPTDPRIKRDLGRFLEAVWTQMAQHYKTRPSSVLFEVQNEPNHLDQAWSPLQQRTISAIRAVDTFHTIVVGGDDWNSIKGMKALPKYSDTNLIYTFHFYDPLIFTHQGAEWAGLKDLAGVTFPPTGRAPDFNGSGPNAWAGKAVRDYYISNAVGNLTASIDAAAAFAKERGVPVWCGEFGVYNLRADPAQRVAWYRTVRGLLEDRHIPWTMWDYKDSFGLFLKGSAEVFDQDLNLPQVEALGFNTVPQLPPGPRAETAGFVLYDDSWKSGSHEAGYNHQGTVDYADSINPHSGTYSIQLSGLDRYANVGWTFAPWKDLTALAGKATLSLWMRASKPFVIQARFVDGSGSGGLPWRIVTQISDRNVPADGQWHHVVVPFSSLAVTGAWDGNWHQGQPDSFDWSRVERFELVAENNDLAGVTLNVDDVEVVLN